MTSVPAVASSANEPAFAGRSPHSGGEIRNALRSLWPHFAMAGIFSSCINLLYLSSPLYLMQVYNRVLVNENITTLILLTLVLAVALLAMAALDTIRAQILIRCGIRLDQMLAARVFQSLIVKSAKQGFSGGAQRLRELDNFRTFITGPGIYFAFDLPWIPVYLLILFFIHPILGVVATLGAAVLLGLAVINEFSTRGPLKKAEASASQSFVFTENIVRHADVVMAMGMRNAVERHWQTNRIGMLNEQAFASDKNAAISSTIRFARLLLQSVMLGTGAWLAIDHSIMPATIFAASIIMGRALVPVEQGVATWKQFIAAREGYGRVRELLADYPDSPPRTIVPAAHNAVGANEIAFSIPARREPILKNLSFELNGGQAIGIVGPSGSGKSTLARLLIGAAAPSRGTLRFGGLDYTQWDQSEFGRLVGYLPQDVGLFAGTVRENIARFGDASIDEIIAAAKLAGIHDMILDLPQQYDTMLGSGGVGLSGGQRQRLGLARALLGAPSLLVLDEPNANLDTAGEEALKRALVAFKARGATIIVITHRTTVLEVVDALMVLRGGQLEMIGPPDAVYDHLKQTSHLKQTLKQLGSDVRRPGGAAMSVWTASQHADFGRADLYANPVKPARVGLVVVAAFILFLGIWGAVAPISGAAIAEGNLQAETQRQSVQHPYGGVVSRLMVKEGQHVEKGQILLILVDSDPRANLDVLLADQAAQLAQESRLIAERDGAAEPSFGSLSARQGEPAVAQAMANERAVMTARARQFETEKGMQQQNIAQSREKIGGLGAQIDGLQRQEDLIEEEAQGVRQLLASGYAPKTRVLALDRNAAQLRADRGAKIGDVAAAEKQVGETELAIAKLERDRITEITDQLRATHSKLAELGPKTDAARDVLDRTRIAAPVSGAVVGLSVFTEGGVIQPGARVLDIVPSDDSLIVEGRLQLTDVNDVKAGSPADVRLTSIPRSERPILKGQVLTVSADKMTDQQTGRGYYSVRVGLRPQDVKAIKFDLQAGMPAEVIVTTRPRTFIDYLTSPLVDEITGAFREK